jgi:hypothetical protein
VVYTHTYSKNEKIIIDKDKSIERNVVEEIYTKIEKKNGNFKPQKHQQHKQHHQHKQHQQQRQQKEKVANKQKSVDTSIFDARCIDMYGETFCILFGLSNIIEVRMFRDGELRCIKYTTKECLHNDIPIFIKDGYTVVVIEENKKNKKYDIICTHSKQSD